MFENWTRRKKRSLKKGFLTKTKKKKIKRITIIYVHKSKTKVDGSSTVFLSWVLYLKFWKHLFQNEIICESLYWFRLELLWRSILEAHLGLKEVDINIWSRSQLNNYEEKKNDYEKEKVSVELKRKVKAFQQRRNLGFNILLKKLIPFVFVLFKFGLLQESHRISSLK